MKRVAVFLLVLTLVSIVVLSVSAVSGAAFTTYNPAVDGNTKEVCKNSIINCNIYGAKEYVWLNGGPSANGLGPDGNYFFVVLEPGGQPNPNDGGPKNLSDDYDTYTNRTFTVFNGEVSSYGGDHWMDSGGDACKGNPADPCGQPDGQPPYIRLFPYADTSNPGGVYIMAICSLEDGYPVAPRDCKYDAFKVKAGQVTYNFMLEGYKIHDLNADGDLTGEPGLPGWEINIDGTGFLGDLIDVTVTTGPTGYWSFQSQDYTFQGQNQPVTAVLDVCETLQSGWYQSAPNPACYHLEIDPQGVTFVSELDFGNYQMVDITACKTVDTDRDGVGDTPVAGWEVYLGEDSNGNGEEDPGEIIDGPQLTGADGCYTWDGDTFNLVPGALYFVKEGSRAGWYGLTETIHFFPEAVSGMSYSFTFENALFEGCTPGFWQGGPSGPDPQAGGARLWNEVQDPQWALSGGDPWNPYIHADDFWGFFGGYNPGVYTMFELVDTGGGSENWRKAARSLVAAYLNTEWGVNYPYTAGELEQMWLDASNAADPNQAFLDLHTLLDTANNAGYRDEAYGPHCPISAGGY